MTIEESGDWRSCVIGAGSASNTDGGRPITEGSGRDIRLLSHRRFLPAPPPRSAIWQVLAATSFSVPGACLFLRRPADRNCNKRAPGSGCDAIGGFNRNHADSWRIIRLCIATHPSDMCVALAALDAKVRG